MCLFTFSATGANEDVTKTDQTSLLFNLEANKFPSRFKGNLRIFIKSLSTMRDLDNAIDYLITINWITIELLCQVLQLIADSVSIAMEVVSFRFPHKFTYLDRKKKRPL